MYLYFQVLEMHNLFPVYLHIHHYQEKIHCFQLISPDLRYCFLNNVNFRIRVWHIQQFQLLSASYFSHWLYNQDLFFPVKHLRYLVIVQMLFFQVVHDVQFRRFLLLLIFFFINLVLVFNPIPFCFLYITRLPLLIPTEAGC